MDDINPEKFYRKLIDEAQLIEETIESDGGDGRVVTYVEFADAAEEATYEDRSLVQYGNATYYLQGKIYNVQIYFPEATNYSLDHREATAVNELNDSEFKDYINYLLQERAEGDHEEFEFMFDFLHKYL